MPGSTVRLSATVAPGRQGKNVQTAQTTGRATRVQVIVPPGCQNLVDSIVFAGDQILAPASGNVLRGDGNTWDLPTNKPILAGTPVTLWVGNGDAQFPHNIEAVVTIEDEPYQGPISGGVLLPQEEEPRLITIPSDVPQPIPPPVIATPPLPLQAMRPQDTSTPQDPGMQLAHHAVTMLGIVAIGLVVAVIVISMPRGDNP